MAATDIEAPAMAAMTSIMAPWGYQYSLPTLPAKGFLATAPGPAALAEPLACGLRRSRLVIEARSAGLGFYYHGSP
jgi:hypothetical protein